MARSDYRRPAEYQVKHHYVCNACGTSTDVESCYAGPAACYCGGRMDFAGESYPANSDDWHEERDDVNDDFRNTSRRGG